jgi:IS1 family transposase
LLKSGKRLPETFELDEIYWFISKKAKTETRENCYVMTMIRPEPRQIIRFDVQMDNTAFRLQGLVDSAPWAESYATDGYGAYLDVVFPGKHVRNIHNKRDTHNVESINADLRHYIPGLARRSRCFYRSLETFQAVLELFVDAYNAFGEAKLKHRVPVVRKSEEPATHLHKFRDPPGSFLDFF